MILLNGRMAPPRGNCVFTGQRPEESPFASFTIASLYAAVSRTIGMVALAFAWSLTVVSDVRSFDAATCSQDVNENSNANGINRNNARSCTKERNVFTSN